MKRKIWIGLLLLVLCFTLVGCGKEKKQESNSTNDTEEVEEDTSSDDEINLYSDDTKIVFELSNTKYVFYYTGDTITAYHTYVDYEDTTIATYTYQNLVAAGVDEDVDKYYQKGRYIVFEWNKNHYEDLTVSNLRTAYSYMKEIKK